MPSVAGLGFFSRKTCPQNLANSRIETCELNHAVEPCSILGQYSGPKHVPGRVCRLDMHLQII